MAPVKRPAGQAARALIHLMSATIVAFAQISPERGLDIERPETLIDPLAFL